MWAMLETWLLGDGEVPQLRVGEVLRDTGLRLSCASLGPATQTTPGAWAAGAPAEGSVSYRMRGAVVAAWQQAAVLDVDGCLILAEPAAFRAVQTRAGHEAVERYSPDFTPPATGTIAEAVGQLEVVPGYEWDAFHRVDARRDWRLIAIRLVRHQIVPVGATGETRRGPPAQVSATDRLDGEADMGGANSYLLELEALETAPHTEPSAPRTVHVMTTDAVVRLWHRDEGWGVVDSPRTPGGCWVHYNQVQLPGGRELMPGQAVALEWEPSEQDGFNYRAVTIKPR